MTGQEPFLFPRPQWTKQLQGEVFAIDAYPALVSTGEVLSEATQFARWMEEDFGLHLSVQSWDTQTPGVHVGLFGDTQVQAYLTRYKLVPRGGKTSAEGYLLHADADGVLVAGHDLAGVFYGLQTLRQLVTREGEGLVVKPIEVHDWPYKWMRGVHLYMPAREHLPFFQRFLEYMAAMHMNTLFLEIGGGMRYDRHPEINQKWQEYVQIITTRPGGVIAGEHGFPFPKDSTHYELAGGSFLEKDEVRQIADWAHELHIEIIPEVQSLSHCYYLAYAHPEIAENTADPYPDTYCPSNPHSYELLFDVMEEVIEVLHPRIIHTGHDELYTLGICPVCQEKDTAELLAGDLIKIHDFLASRNIRMAMWGDKLMNIILGGRPMGGRESIVQPGTWFSNTEPYIIPETYPAVDCVPKDILIINWYWTVDSQSHVYFEQHGFEQIYGNMMFQGPTTMPDWADQTGRKSLYGGEVSTWCEVSEKAFGHNVIFFNIAYAAEALWWQYYSIQERGIVLERVAKLQSRIRSRMNGQVLPSLAQNRQYMCFHLPVDDGQVTSIQGLPGGVVTLQEIPFSIPEGDSNMQWVDADHPAAEPILVQAKAQSLIFLHHCRCQRKYYTTYGDHYIVLPTPDGLLGWYAVEYHDGTTVKVALEYGENIANWHLHFGEDKAACPYWAEPAWEGRDEAGRPVVLYRYEWVNPHPEKGIRSVQLHSASGEGQIRLAGVTGVKSVE